MLLFVAEIMETNLGRSDGLATIFSHLNKF